MLYMRAIAEELLFERRCRKFTNAERRDWYDHTWTTQRQERERELRKLRDHYIKYKQPTDGEPTEYGVIW